jgi:hypothetical protein
MLSFEVSAIDLILAVAVIILLIFYMKNSSAKTPAQEELLVEKENLSRKPDIEDARLEKETTKPTQKPQKDSATCPYDFGYLRKLDKDASIPDKCLGCSRVMECSTANE